MKYIEMDRGRAMENGNTKKKPLRSAHRAKTK